MLVLPLFSLPFLSLLEGQTHLSAFWRVVRVVEGATLEKSCAARHLGFESLTLRQLPEHDPLREKLGIFKKVPGFLQYIL